MSKYVLRLIVVLVIVVGVTVGVVLFLTRPDPNLAIFNMYVQSTNETRYSQHRYLNTTYVDKDGNASTTVIAKEPAVKHYYDLARTVNGYVEEYLAKAKFAKNFGSAADGLKTKLTAYFDATNNNNGSGYWAKAFYDYLNSSAYASHVLENKFSTYQDYVDEVRRSLIEEAFAGASLVDDLRVFVVTHVYGGAEDVTVLGTLFDALIAQTKANVFLCKENFAVSTMPTPTSAQETFFIGLTKRYNVAFASSNPANLVGHGAFVAEYWSIARDVRDGYFASRDRDQYISTITVQATKDSLAALKTFIEAGAAL